MSSPCQYCGVEIPTEFDTYRAAHVQCMNKEWAERYKFRKGQYVNIGIRIDGGYRSIDGFIVGFDSWGIQVRAKNSGKIYSTDHLGNVLPYLDQSHLQPKQLSINF